MDDFDTIPVDYQPDFGDAPGVGYVPASTNDPVTSRVAAAGTGMAHGIADMLAAPGNVAQGQQPQIPGQWSDVDEAIRQANMRGESVWGPQMAMTMVGTPGLAGAVPEGALASSARGLPKTTLPMDEESRMARAAEQGFEGPWYHGAWRTDRLTEKGAIDPRRATSGPMPFFTDDPEMASGYAMGKKMDTSLEDYGDVKQYFTVDPKEVFPGSRMRTPMTVEQSWHYLPREVQQDILSKAKRVGYANPDTGDGPIVLHPEGVEATLSPDHYDYVMKTEARGNPLAALREMWHDGGNLVGNESELSHIYQLAGYPYKISEANAPWTEARGVLPAMLRMRNPLQTDDQNKIINEIIPALERQFKGDRSRTAQFGADMWDKNSRWTPREWIAQAKEDYAKGDNSFVWTSIPDKISNAIRSMGYDSIIDTGGKMGGQSHQVAIPFSPQQVRSKYAAFDPKNENREFLLGSGATNRSLSGALTVFGTQPVDHDPFQ